MHTTASKPISVVLSTETSPRRRWRSIGTGGRVVVVSTVSMLVQAISALDEFDNFIGRIVFDHSASDTEILTLMHRLPGSFRGDVLVIREQWASLTKCAQDGRRSLIEMTPRQAEGYLRAHMLVSPAKPASAVEPRAA